MPGTPSGFTYEQRRNGDVELRHHGRPAGVLRGRQAARFLAEVDGTEVDGAEVDGAEVDGEHLQQLMARLTGNYRHGNERTARNHPRNQGGR